MINFIAKKSFEFHNPSDRNETFRTTPNVFLSAPDWITKDPLYGWGVSDGDIIPSNTVQAPSADVSTPDTKADSKTTDAKADSKDTTADAKSVDAAVDTKDAKADSKTTGK